MLAFTGARNIDKTQAEIVKEKLNSLNDMGCVWHVGDAMGVDAVVRIAAKKYNKTLHIHVVNGHQRYDFAKRSKRMIDAISNTQNSKLIAFANKPCPKDCKPSKNPSGEGSGTWLTAAYAHYLGIPIEVIFLQSGLELPDWLQLGDTKESGTPKHNKDGSLVRFVVSKITVISPYIY
jgi:hypothetical protein